MSGHARRDRGDPVAEANLLLFVAVHEAMAGEFADALDHAAAGRTATRELGLRWQTGIHSCSAARSACSPGTRSRRRDWCGLPWRRSRRTRTGGM